MTTRRTCPRCGAEQHEAADGLRVSPFNSELGEIPRCPPPDRGRPSIAETLGGGAAATREGSRGTQRN